MHAQKGSLPTDNEFIHPETCRKTALGRVKHSPVDQTTDIMHIDRALQLRTPQAVPLLKFTNENPALKSHNPLFLSHLLQELFIFDPVADHPVRLFTHL